MHATNGGLRAMFRVIKNLWLDIGGVAVYVHVWIIKNAPYWVLLGRPFQIAAQADMEGIGMTLALQDPLRPGFKLHVPMHLHKNLPCTPPSHNFLLGELAILTAASLSLLSMPQTPSLMTPLVASSNSLGCIFDSLPMQIPLSAIHPSLGGTFMNFTNFLHLCWV